MIGTTKIRNTTTIWITSLTSSAANKEQVNSNVITPQAHGLQPVGLKKVNVFKVYAVLLVFLPVAVMPALAIDERMSVSAWMLRSR